MSWFTRNSKLQECEDNKDKAEHQLQKENAFNNNVIAHLLSRLSDERQLTLEKLALKDKQIEGLQRKLKIMRKGRTKRGITNSSDSKSDLVEP